MRVKPLYDEKELLQRVAGGDERAFRTLYERYSRKIYLFSLRILRSEVEAEEIVQESLLNIWLLGEGLNAISNLDAYLKVVSRNACYNQLRRQRLEQAAFAGLTSWEEATNETEERIAFNETKVLVQQAIDTLPDYHRKVYELCQQEGLKYKETADRLQLSPYTVQTYMKQALRTIRQFLHKHADLVSMLVALNFF